MHAILRRKTIPTFTEGPLSAVAGFMGIRSTIANQPDKDGLTPLHVAALNNDAEAVEILMEFGARPKTVAGVTPQDIARQKGYWRVLAALPDDRALPVGMQKGMNLERRKALQQALADWGYYNDEIDGALGRGSAAALKAYFKDRAAEFKLLCDSGSEVWKRAVFDNGDVLCSADRDDGLQVHWFAYEWSDGDRFVGFSERNPKGITNGIGLYTWDSGEEEVMLLGPDGFDDEQRIQ